MRSRRSVWLGLVVLAACSGQDSGSSPSTSDGPGPTVTTTVVSGISPTTAAATTSQPPTGETALWSDVTAAALPEQLPTWSNRVELADLDDDGDLDVLVADGGDQSSAGEPLVSQVWINDGTAVFSDASVAVFGPTPGLSSAIKARDVDGDGSLDLFVAGMWQTQSRLLLGQGGGAFQDVSATHLPQTPLSAGDAEFGDVDGDGDLDVVITDWGEGHPALSGGGLTVLWLNDGSGGFSDGTADRMPAVAVEWSYDVELIDIDNDFDLDVAVSCSGCSGGFLFENDGAGFFSDVSERIPQFTNNYEYEPMDIDGDGFLDLVTLNDGEGLTDHVLINDGAGGFEDVTGQVLLENLEFFENMAVFLDADSDGDADVVLGDLGDKDRLLVNDGGSFSVRRSVFDGTGSATFALALGDLNGDKRIDVFMGIGGRGDEGERVYLGSGIAPDTAPPIVGLPTELDGFVHVRAHDNGSPLRSHDLAVTLRRPDGTIGMHWYGEYLWRAEVGGPGEYRICAVDAAGNEACSEAFDAGS